MDVQATAEASPLPPVSFPPLPSPPAGAPTPPPAPPVSSVAPSNTSGGSSNGSSSSVQTGSPPPSSQVHIASLPPPPTPVDDGTLGSTVAKLFNTASENVAVSFQVAQGSNEVVVVFTDKTSGKTIIQFPSETLIALAQFFNKLAGTVLDKKA
jgi:hypothetical protein